MKLFTNVKKCPFKSPLASASLTRPLGYISHLPVSRTPLSHKTESADNLQKGSDKAWIDSLTATCDGSSTCDDSKW